MLPHFADPVLFRLAERDGDGSRGFSSRIYAKAVCVAERRPKDRSQFNRLSSIAPQERAISYAADRQWCMPKK